ncbi:MAG: tRNA pseudouridine55 synthase [Candidatus Saccharimonadales bacterium]|jgi:tRNA pseudouridine55 synthase
MEGILLVDKPEGWTSFDVVNYVRKIVTGAKRSTHKSQGYCNEPNVGNNDKCRCKIKVGHTGTLDPAATGLLVVCVGKEYTKKVPTLIKMDKTYEVEVSLGQKSTTGDKEGELETISSSEPSEDDVNRALEKFVGEIDQVPPAHSAIKIDGKRAYELARAGKEVKMASRKVTIHSIDSVSYKYPFITFATSVGSGTYIRSLAEDIGTELGTGAYMSNLRRTTVGQFSIDEALQVSEITEDSLQIKLA